MIHYGNLNSSRKFEFITEEFKSITGKTGVSLRILDFITKNENSSRKNHDFSTSKIFHDRKRSIFQMNFLNFLSCSWSFCFSHDTFSGILKSPVSLCFYCHSDLKSLGIKSSIKYLAHREKLASESRN